MKRRKPGKRKHRITDRQQVQLQQAVRAHSSGQFAAAETGYRALIAENVASPELYCNLAAICAHSGRRDEADTLWKTALEIDPGSVDARLNLADSARLAGDLDRASKMYRRILADNKRHHIARYMLGNVLKAQGKLDEATDCYQQVMAQEPGYTQAHFSYSGIHKYQDRSDPHIDAMLAVYPGTAGRNTNRTHLDFALAKAYEDIGDYSEAFGYLKSGNQLRAREFNYNVDGDTALIDSIISTFNKEACANVKVDAPESKRPIFIVGMVRSGTSLVEKILASHTDVYGAGELEYMFALGTSRFLGRENNFTFQPLSSYDEKLFAEVGESYLEQIRKLDDESPRVTDKMPFNMMMIGLIRLALPNAKIIHCARDARDTCLSIYKQNFTTGNYRFAYDLKSVAQFHKLYQKLMAHWHETFPGDIYDVSYESLTQDPENEIRRLLAACDLEFQPDCVSFEKTKAVVKTASAFQVRQPMYTSSVSLWQRYEEHLGPMLEELESA